MSKFILIAVFGDIENNEYHDYYHISNDRELLGNILEAVKMEFDYPLLTSSIIALNDAESESEYYFISYAVRDYMCKYWDHQRVVIEGSYLEWLIEQKHVYHDVKLNYVNKISKEEYDKYRIFFN